MKYITPFKEYDMFGKEPTLYIAGQDYYGTLFGLFITKIAIIAYCVCSGYFILEMFDKKNVSSFTSVQNPTIPLSINFTSDKFYLTFAIEDPVTYNTVLDESIYTVDAVYKIATRQDDGNLKWESYPVELEPCQLSKFNKKYQTLFSKRDVQHKYCIKKFTYNIEGTFLHDKYSFIMFDFYQCKNTTENNNKCKPQEDIDYYLNGTFIAIEFTDIALDQSNYTYPDSPIIGETYTTISKNFYREMHIYLKEVLFRSDIGYVFSSIEEKEYIQLDYLHDMFTLQPKDMFCSLTLKLSNRIDVYERKYIKFQTALANIGGIIKAISTIGIIMTYCYSQTKYEVDMTNKIFFVSDRKNCSVSPFSRNLTNLDSNRNNVKQINKNMVDVSEAGSNSNCLSQSKISSISKFYQNEKRLSKLHNGSVIKYTQKTIITHSFTKNEILNTIKKAKINLGVFDFFFYKIFTRCLLKKKNIKLLKKGANLIKEKLDIIYLIRTIINQSRIKEMIFSKEQKTLFNLLYKPELNLEKTKEEIQVDFVESADEYLPYVNQRNKKALELIEHDTTEHLINNNIFYNCLDYNMKALLSAKDNIN